MKGSHKKSFFCYLLIYSFNELDFNFSLRTISLIPRNSSEYNFTIKITVMESIIKNPFQITMIINWNVGFIFLLYLTEEYLKNH